MNSKISFRDYFAKLGFLFIILILLVGVISNPQLSLKSASSGVSVWLNIIIPSLLPFFIVSELLIRLGFVDFVGKLLGPIMYPLFNVPGQGAFPLTMSVISGYPVGSKIASRLREDNSISKNQGDRLICFTSTSGPLFMLGAVGIGMLKAPELGALIILPHYLSVIILGLIFKYYNKDRKNDIQNKRKRSLFEEISTSYQEWLKTKKSIGSLITISIKESMDTIILIGGLVIFYSVLVEILFNIDFIDKIISNISSHFTMDQQLVKGTIVGFFEVTTGCKNIAAANSSLIEKIIVINFIIGWGGISVHSQALSFINNTDLNSKLYIFSKFLHGVFSAIISYGLYLLRFSKFTQSTFSNSIFVYNQFDLSNWLYLLISSMELAIIISMFLLLTSIFVFFISGN